MGSRSCAANPALKALPGVALETSATSRVMSLALAQLAAPRSRVVVRTPSTREAWLAGALSNRSLYALPLHRYCYSIFLSERSLGRPLVSWGNSCSPAALIFQSARLHCRMPSAIAVCGRPKAAAVTERTRHRCLVSCCPLEGFCTGLCTSSAGGRSSLSASPHTPTAATGLQRKIVQLSLREALGMVAQARNGVSPRGAPL